MMFSQQSYPKIRNFFSCSLKFKLQMNKRFAKKWKTTKQIFEWIQRYVDNVSVFCFSQLTRAKKDIQNMYKSNVFNLETMKTRLRDLNNRAQNCKTIPEDFRSKYMTLNERRNVLTFPLRSH